MNLNIANLILDKSKWDNKVDLPKQEEESKVKREIIVYGQFMGI